ncbi:ABC transporter substrate-binding protein [Halalkalibacter krulwichiae]|uniref:Glutathione-binding protein GsiB n=1 Tax=Halalkalibacter krulwichiae TaxID=199441 RepID=A0A1X9M952_9BACI|nr:ABC transporter substrate-binding protein [Halalkalibacter krulwichiae]ARK29926.1 Glutathione-binding protein GsiB precursor [Halalkalibacter krulwichiae]
MKVRWKFQYINVTGVIVLFLLAITLAGCNSSNDVTTAEENVSSQEKNGEKSSEDKYGGTLKVVFGDPVVNIGLPPLIRGRGDIVIAMSIYENLARYNENGEVEPWLAEGWEADPSSNKIEVELKQGIQFHDGTPFNAEAVKWNLELYRDNGRVEAAAIDTIDVVDDYNLTINLSRWDNTIFDNLFGFAQMASPTAYEQNGEEWLKDNPVGTGAFVLKEWVKDEKVTVERNENYWVEGLPYLDGVEFHTITESSTAEAAMVAGEFDLYLFSSPQVTSNLEKDFVIEALENGMGAIGNSMAPDSEDPNSPLANSDVRKAIGYAIDKEAIVEAVYFGYAEVAHQWSVQKAANYNPDVEGTPYNPEKAKELLKKAGFGDGFDLTITFVNNPDLTQLYTAIQAYLAEVGINVDLNGVQSQEWQEMTGSEGEWDGLINSVFRISNDVTFDFNRSLASTSSHYRSTKLSEEAEELLSQAQTISTSEELLELSHELQKQVFDEEQTSIPLVVGNMLLAQNGNVQEHGFLKSQLTHWSPEATWMQQ